MGCRLLTVVVETLSMIGGIDEIVEEEIAGNVAIVTRTIGKVSIGVYNGAEWGREGVAGIGGVDCVVGSEGVDGVVVIEGIDCGI